MLLSPQELLAAQEHDSHRCLQALLGLQPLLSEMPEPQTLFEQLMPLLSKLVPRASMMVLEVSEDFLIDVMASYGDHISPSRTLLRRAMGEHSPVFHVWNAHPIVLEDDDGSSIGVPWALAAPVTPSAGRQFALYAVGLDAFSPSAEGHRAPGELDRAVIALMAEVLTQYLEGRRAARLQMQYETELQQRKLAESLRELTSSVTSTLNLTEVLERLLDSLSRIVPSVRALALVKREDSLIGMAGRGGTDARDIHVLRIPLVENQLLAQLEQDRRPFVVQDAARDARLSPYPSLQNVEMVLVVPLMVRDEVMGVLFLGRGADSEPFSDKDVDLAWSFATQAGVALQNANLFQEVQRLASTDELTGAANRRQFFALASHEWTRARKDGKPVSAISFDVDHFKKFNDTYGHALGDRVLKHVAERTRKGLREDDIFGRLGGEEFTVLVSAPKQRAAQIAEKIRTTIGDCPLDSDVGQLKVTISVGVATSSADVADLADLLRRADEALYAAKNGGRNCVVVDGAHPVSAPATG
jgi:diguanylate cyclase (GGDEF)-like protein